MLSMFLSHFGNLAAFLSGMELAIALITVFVGAFFYEAHCYISPKLSDCIRNLCCNRNKSAVKRRAQGDGVNLRKNQCVD